MSRIVECSKCGADISESYQGAEPDVGIMMGGWYCDACDLTIDDEDGPELHDDDIQLFGQVGKVHLVGSHICQRCRVPLKMGYGLAGGGGIGPYMYCKQRQMREGGGRTKKESGAPAVNIKALLGKVQTAAPKPQAVPKPSTGAGFVRRF